MTSSNAAGGDDGGEGGKGQAWPCNFLKLAGLGEGRGSKRSNTEPRLLRPGARPVAGLLDKCPICTFKFRIPPVLFLSCVGVVVDSMISPSTRGTS
eukprot:764739-Hanusia_phi.AAC.2